MLWGILNAVSVRTVRFLYVRLCPPSGPSYFFHTTRTPTPRPNQVFTSAMSPPRGIFQFHPLPFFPVVNRTVHLDPSPVSSSNNRSITVFSSFLTSSLTKFTALSRSLFVLSKYSTKSQNSLTPSPVSLGSVLAFLSAAAPLRSPTSLVHGCGGRLPGIEANCCDKGGGRVEA